MVGSWAEENGNSLCEHLPILPSFYLCPFLCLYLPWNSCYPYFWKFFQICSLQHLSIKIRRNKTWKGNWTADWRWLLFYKKLQKDIVGHGFKINPVDPCVANKEVNRKQLTVVWNIDDIKISHSDPQVVTDQIKWFKSRLPNYKFSHNLVLLITIEFWESLIYDLTRLIVSTVNKRIN